MRSAVPVALVILLWGWVCLSGPATGRSPCAAAEDLPSWLNGEALRPLPSYPSATEAVILLDDRSVAVSPKGVFVTKGRLAVRVLRPGAIDGARRLTLVRTFDRKIRDMTGWSAAPGGRPRKATFKQAVFSSLSSGAVYGDAETATLFVPEVTVGSVVGFEWEEERKPLSFEDAYMFQGPYPVRLARYVISVPPGWEPSFRLVNWETAGTSPDGPGQGTLMFEAANIPPLADEPFSPADGALAGRLTVRVTPPGPDARALADWPDIGAWYGRLAADECLPDRAVSAKAAEIAATAPDVVSRIRALAEFVQRDIRYFSINVGIGGFEPHPAATTLSGRYGDCKDKAALLSALMRALDIASHIALVHTDRGVVKPDSPASLYTFNHAVLAVRLPDGADAAGLEGLVPHPGLGRLLILDPTTPFTPPGRLPAYLQDNAALIAAAGSGGVVRIPGCAPEANAIDRTARLVLTADGALVGEVREVRRGAPADTFRALMQGSTETERRERLETFLSGSFPSFTLKDFEIRHLDDLREDVVAVYRFIAPSFAKKAGRFMAVRPRVLGTMVLDIASDEKGPRRNPLDLGTAYFQRDEFVIELPEGFAAEGDLPGPLDLRAGFASCRIATEAREGALVHRREFWLTEPLLPASRYEEARRFFADLGAEERRSVLLKVPDPRRP